MSKFLFEKQILPSFFLFKSQEREREIDPEYRAMPAKNSSNTSSILKNPQNHQYHQPVHAEKKDINSLEKPSVKAYPNANFYTRYNPNNLSFGSPEVLLKAKQQFGYNIVDNSVNRTQFDKPIRFGAGLKDMFAGSSSVYRQEIKAVQDSVRI